MHTYQVREYMKLGLKVVCEPKREYIPAHLDVSGIPMIFHVVKRTCNDSM